MKARRFVLLSIALLACLSAATATADELTKMIQRDLVLLGYEPGKIDGKTSVKTAVAISKFQAENGLEVTGEASPQLAGLISAKASQQHAATSTVAGPAASPGSDELKAAQQACLQKIIDEKQSKQKKKRGLGRLLNAVGRTAVQFGGYDLARTTNDVYAVGASAEDIAAAAEDLGLTPDDISGCENPH